MHGTVNDNRRNARFGVTLDDVLNKLDVLNATVALVVHDDVITFGPVLLAIDFQLLVATTATLDDVPRDTDSLTDPFGDDQFLFV